MTRLKDGCEEEYKARHDRRVAERERLQIPVRTVISVSGAPEDIFSAMMKLTLPWKQRKRLLQEKQRFPGKCVSLRSWTGDTNDVDWMTGEVHADVKRLAWHN